MESFGRKQKMPLDLELMMIDTKKLIMQTEILFSEAAKLDLELINVT